MNAVGQKQAFMYFCIVLQLKIYENLKKKDIVEKENLS